MSAIASLLVVLAMLLASGAAVATDFNPHSSSHSSAHSSADANAHSRAATGNETAMLARIAAIQEAAMRRGWFQTKVQVKLNENPEFEDSPGYLIPEFDQAQCILYISPKAMIRYGFLSEFRLRFFIYHEVAHCDQYLDPAALTVLPSAGTMANRLLSDLIQLEFLHPSAANRLNGYNIHQETYADVKAIAVLRAEGASRHELQTIVSFRQQSTGVLDTHQTQNAAALAVNVAWEDLSLADLEGRVRLLASDAMVESFFVRTFQLGTIPFVASSLVQGAVRQPLSVARFTYSDPSDRAFMIKRIQDVLASGNPTWETFAKLEQQGTESDRLVSMFFEKRYGLSPDRMQALDDEIAIALRTRIGSNVAR